MYQITVNKVLYTKTKRGIKREFKRILTTKTTKDNLVNRLIELKQTFKDFNYNIEFVKI